MKKIFSTILSIVMLINILAIPMVANAAELDTNKANISFVYLGNGDKPAETAMDFPANPPKGGEKIWIGVQFSNMSKLRTLFNSDTPGVGSGLNNMTLGVLYDEDILTPNAVSAKNLLKYTKGRYPEYVGEDDDTEDLYKYESINNSGTNGLNDTCEPNNIKGTKKSSTLNFTVDNGSTPYMDGGANAPRIFQDNVVPFADGEVDDDPVIYGYFSFTVKEGAVIDSDYTILQAGLGQNIFTMGIGNTGSIDDGGNALQWNVNESTDADTNLKNYFNLTDKDGNPTEPKIDLWPKQYTVGFYNSYNADTTTYGAGVSDKITVNDGSSVSKVVASTKDTENPVTVPTEDDFTAPEGKFYNGLKYLDKEGNVQSFDDTMTINSDVFAEGVTELKVYADWVDGNKITFNSNYGDNKPSGVSDEKTKVVSIAPTATTIAADNSDIPTTSGDAPEFPAPDGYTFGGWYKDADCTQAVTLGESGTTFADGDNVYAKWIENVEIIYDDNGGTGGPGTVSKTPSTVYTDPTAPTRDKYDFAGWNTKSNGAGTKVQADTTKTFKDIVGTDGNTGSSITLYAQWTPKADQDTVTLTFDTVGGEAAKPSTITVVKGDAITDEQMPDTPTKTSATGDPYTFLGWFEDASLTNENEIKAPITLDEDKTAYAHWSYDGKDQVKITFNDNGATTVVTPTEVIIGKGDSIGAAMPTDPKKDDNTFGGWYEDVSDEGTKKDADSIFTADATLTAKWVADVTFTYDDNLGTGGPGEVKVPAGNVYTDPITEPTRTGYDFAGWNTKSNGSGDDITADGTKTNAEIAELGTTLYAQWTANGSEQVDLTFDANLEGVTPNPEVVTVNKGDSVYKVNVPEVSKANYQFDGWYESASITDTTKIDFESGYEVSEDKTVYAHWTYTGEDAVTVTFKNGDATYGTATVAPNATLGEMMPVDPTKEGFTFKEWNKAENGEGDSFTKTTDVGTTSFTVYAQYYSNIKVTYDANGGENAPASVTKSAADEYKDPDVSGMTKTVAGTDYTFVGWNTEKNGSGSKVKEETGLTYGQVAEMFKTGETTPNEVTVYAQWARVTDPDDVDGDDPASNGVRVTFDSNAYGATADSVVDANPKYKYPVLGDSIGDDNMPTEPTRDNYTFDGWYLNKQGEGTEFKGTTKVDAATLGDALKTIAGSADKYEVTLYAKWKLNDDVAEENKVTVTFNKNSDGTGKVSDDIKTVTLYKGDALGYDVEAPENKITNGEYDFIGWYEGSLADGKVSFTENKFAAETPINADTTYYAKWQMYLLIQVQPNMVDGSETDYTYTGKEIVPQYKVLQITYPDGTDKPYSIVNADSPIYSGDLSDSDDFAVTYKKDGGAETLKNAGTYQIDVSFKADSALKAAGADSIVIDPTTIEIKPAGLTFKVDPEKQVQKFGQVTLPTVESVEGIQNFEAQDLVFGNGFYTKDGTEIESASDITEVGHYLWKIELKTGNYIIENVVSSADGKEVLKYNITDGYTDFEGTNEGQNLVLDVIANDPSISAVTVESSQAGENKESLTLKDSSYVDTTFDSSEDPENKDYFIRVTDTDADQVSFTFTLTNPDTTTLTASEGSTVTKNDDGTYTVVAPITNKGATTNELTITTKAGDKTIDYTFTIQQLVEAKITLNYGNSPYGEIMKDDAIVGKEAAKAAFDNSDTEHGNLQFGADFIPALGITNVKYTTAAWNSYDENYDKDENAIFVYEASDFVEPGLKVYNQLGEEVENATYDRALVVKKMAVGEPNYDKDDLDDLDLSVAGGTNSTVFSLKGNIVRPDVYTMTYTYKYKDLNGAEQTLTTTRNVIVLSKRGDIQLTTDPTFNANDGKAFATSYGKWGGVSANSLFAFRVCDLQETTDATVNANDYKQLISDLSKYSETPYNQYYRPLPEK